jgi:alkylation response protein AidB-like acyl-CoA dehydrogenase
MRERSGFDKCVKLPAMDFDETASDAAFRTEIQGWLAQHLVGRFAEIGEGQDLTASSEARADWERELGLGCWIGVSWPEEYGGRGLSLLQQVILGEEFARAGAPQRAFFGENLLGPTLIALGTDEQKQRFLPPILRGEETWCQGFSEPDAGSDLAGLKTRAVLDGDDWVIDGQKLWTSQATEADWIFALCRTSDEGVKHRGISFLLVPIDQPGVTIRPLRQITGTSEFNEVFFDGARTSADLVVGGVGQGWKVAMATLGFERGTAFLSQQVRFAREYWRIVAVARDNGALRQPAIRQRLAHAYAGLEIMRYVGARTVSSFARGTAPGAEASIGKLFWSQWHQRLGVLEMDIIGLSSQIVGPDYHLDGFQEAFLFSRAHTIYAGASEIQRNILGERVLGLPREPVS